MSQPDTIASLGIKNCLQIIEAGFAEWFYASHRMGPAQILLKNSARIALRETYRIILLSIPLFSHWSIPLSDDIYGFYFYALLTHDCLCISKHVMNHAVGQHFIYLWTFHKTTVSLLSWTIGTPSTFFLYSCIGTNLQILSLALLGTNRTWFWAFTVRLVQRCDLLQNLSKLSYICRCLTKWFVPQCLCLLL